MTVFNGELIAGGQFDRAGGMVAKHIAYWNGSTWHALADGMNGGVWALTVYNGELIAGGLFGRAGGVEANYIARWSPP